MANYKGYLPHSIQAWDNDYWSNEDIVTSKSDTTQNLE